ncbi:MAG: hypothetical protein MZW92_39840 [Comamonadaceae bacterium]|nr:hypothetical protein [Comamonadaceae bacterium]
MTDYVERHLAVDRGEANRAAPPLLAALRRDPARPGAPPRASTPHHFLRETHDFDVAGAACAPSAAWRALFARLPGRKVLLTNAPSAYAERGAARARRCTAPAARATRSSRCALHGQLPAQAVAADAAPHAGARAGAARRGRCWSRTAPPT